MAETEVIEAPVAPEAPVTLRDDLRSALSELKERDGAESDAAKLQEIEDKRARDEAGRFVAKPVERPEAPKPERKTLTLPEAKPQADPAASASTPVVKAPEGWKAELKEQFATLPPQIQAEISRREADMHKAFTRQDEERQFGKRVLEMTAPYLGTIRQEGGDPLAAYNLYLQTAQTLRTGTPQQKVEALLSVARQFNVPLGQPVQQGQQGYDPRVDQAMQEVNTLKQYLQQEAHQRQLAEQATLQSEIDGFAQEAGHEHFETVKTRMGVLLENGYAKDLQDAYDQAIWSEPAIRSTLSATLMAPETKRLTEQIAKADAARKASGSVTGGPGGARPTGNGSDPSASLRDELRANLRAAQGRI